MCCKRLSHDATSAEAVAAPALPLVVSSRVDVVPSTHFQRPYVLPTVVCQRRSVPSSLPEAYSSPSGLNLRVGKWAVLWVNICLVEKGTYLRVLGILMERELCCWDLRALMDRPLLWILRGVGSSYLLVHTWHTTQYLTLHYTPDTVHGSEVTLERVKFSESVVVVLVHLEVLSTSDENRLVRVQRRRVQNSGQSYALLLP